MKLVEINCVPEKLHLQKGVKLQGQNFQNAFFSNKKLTITKTETGI